MLASLAVNVFHGGNVVADLKLNDFAQQMEELMTVTSIDAGNRIQLPADWMQDLGLRGLVALERTSEGILVRPCPPATWDDIFATKLVIGSASPAEQEDDIEVTGNDFLF